jgi:CHAT domain-containing protein
VLADPVFEKDDPRIPSEFRAQASALAGQGDGAEQTEVAELQQAVRDVGVPGAGASIPRLLASRAEAEAIMQFTPSGAGLKAIGFDASRATATSPELSTYRIVHFATHGLLNSEHPELSGVILSLVDQKGQPVDGFLRLHDIYNLSLPADLVVLSACNTGLGKDVKGEGLIGLTRGFMYAGAAGVMASLWKVDDEATAELMKQFYRGMLKDGLPPAAALRQAQVMMWKQKARRSPYYWAAFVLQGEYRERIAINAPAEARTGRIVAAGVVVLVFSIGGGLYAMKRRRRNTMQTMRAPKQ